MLKDPEIDACAHSEGSENRIELLAYCENEGSPRSHEGLEFGKGNDEHRGGGLEKWGSKCGACFAWRKPVPEPSHALSLSVGTGCNGVSHFSVVA